MLCDPQRGCRHVDERNQFGAVYEHPGAMCLAQKQVVNVVRLRIGFVAERDKLVAEWV